MDPAKLWQYLLAHSQMCQRLPVNFSDSETFIGDSFRIANITHHSLLNPERHHLALGTMASRQHSKRSKQRFTSATDSPYARLLEAIPLRDRCFGLRLWRNSYCNNQMTVIGFRRLTCPNRFASGRNTTMSSMIRTFSPSSKL